MYKGLLVGKRRSIFRERSVHLEQNKSNEEGTETRLEREVAAIIDGLAGHQKDLEHFSKCH